MMYARQIDFSHYPSIQELAMDYETEFADLPETVGTRDAMLILNVESVQGIHYIMAHLPEGAPAVHTQALILGKRKVMMYRKSDLIALRRHRDKTKN